MLVKRGVKIVIRTPGKDMEDVLKDEQELILGYCFRYIPWGGKNSAILFRVLCLSEQIVIVERAF
ncbi:MAG: hypothetical protein ABIE43_03025 [Patescibacteria group bacterium]